MRTGLRSGRARWGMAVGAAAALALGVAVPAAARTGDATQAPGGGPETSAEAYGPRGGDRQAADLADTAPDGDVGVSAITASDLTYSTVDACRTFDSRLSGPAFGYGEGYLLDLTVPCGLPNDGSVEAVMANVISVNAAGQGYVRAAPYDPSFTDPGATVLNFNNGMVASNAVPLSICSDVGCEWDLDLWIPAQARSHIVIDIIGYFS